MKRVTFLISTYNRREVLERTLAVLDTLSPAGAWQTIVVDNASTDGTTAMVRERYPDVLLLARKINAGACAKNVALPYVRGEYIVLLDDDSFPLPGSVDQMVSHFEADDGLGAAVFRVHLPDGREECSAYPGVFTGAGVGLRTSAIKEVGLLPNDYFMQAEEYDLTLRLMRAAWRTQRFDDLHVRHEKTGQSRFPDRTMRLDVRNNLTLISRFFPARWRAPFALDWAMRYHLIAKATGRQRAFAIGLAQGMARLTLKSACQPLSDSAFESFTQLSLIEHRMAEAKRTMNLQRVIFVDLGKNMLPYWIAAQKAGLSVVAIADDNLGAHGGYYRACPVVTDLAARALRYDGAILSNNSPVHGTLRKQQFTIRSGRPVLDLCAAA